MNEIKSNHDEQRQCVSFHFRRQRRRIVLFQTATYVIGSILIQFKKNILDQ